MYHSAVSAHQSNAILCLSFLKELAEKSGRREGGREGRKEKGMEGRMEGQMDLSECSDMTVPFSLSLSLFQLPSAVSSQWHWWRHPLGLEGAVS